ncbi:MAG: phosphatidylglycerophosphatase A [Elusimicrobia bacterium]|nr:phosphatidylglycerophosphatase A [Elusimicrobiota bacterium]
MNAVWVAFASCMYLSYIPAKLSSGLGVATTRRWTGAGAVGTLVGWALWYGLPKDPGEYWAAVSVLTVIACWVCDGAERALGVHDDTRIVLDETVGFWAAAACLPPGTAWLAAAFVLFRILDAVKLPPYRWLERLPGGCGVVMDDVGAGVAANLILQLTARVIVG